MTALAAAGREDLIVLCSCLQPGLVLAGSCKTKPSFSFLPTRFVLKGLILQFGSFSFIHHLRRSSFPFPAGLGCPRILAGARRLFIELR